MTLTKTFSNQKHNNVPVHKVSTKKIWFAKDSVEEQDFIPIEHRWNELEWQLHTRPFCLIINVPGTEWAQMPPAMFQNIVEVFLE